MANSKRPSNVLLEIARDKLLIASNEKRITFGSHLDSS